MPLAVTAAGSSAAGPSPGPRAAGRSSSLALVDGDAPLLARLRAGEEAAFVELVDRYSSPLLRVALTYVPSRAIAEEVVQETWLGVLRGVDGFEGRSSLKTWVFTILVNRARTRGRRERRTVPFSALAGHVTHEDSGAVDPSRFLPADHERWPGHWAAPPRRWSASPEQRLATKERLGLIKEAIATLPATQRTVIVLRDVEGWESREVCNALGLSETNQRVLLHRARSKVRALLEDDLADEQS